jgi:DNA-3-methyladenine glycosylase I
MSEPVRCPWSTGSQLYRDYHDREWGRPLHGRDALFERVCLETFQAGLSWIIVLRKREAFRAAFHGFVVERVAAFDSADVDRLLADPGIVRNRAKIAACVANAQLIRDTDVDLDALLWSFAPPPRPRPAAVAQIPAVTAESTAMAAELRRLGFRFIGPTTAYALMQAVGMVDDHLADCETSM